MIERTAAWFRPAARCFALAAAAAAIACTPLAPGEEPDNIGAGNSATPATATVARRAPPEPPPINDDPRQLLALDGQGLAKLLGKPGFVRRDPPAQLWRYRNRVCILDLYLYRAEADGEIRMAVRHFEARSLSKTSTSPRRCLGALLTDRRDRKPG